MRAGRIAFVSLVFIGAVVLGTSAEEGSAPSPADPVGGLPFSGEVDVTVVNVNVYVTDKEGNAVTDLTAADFTISQDGVARTISNFSLFTEELYRSFFQPDDLPPGLATTTTAPELEGLSRESFRPVYVVLYFDNDYSRALDRNRLITQLRTFIRENLRPPVQMMVVTYDKKTEVLQTFTTDEREIYDALREVRTMVGGRTEVDNTRKDIIRQFNESQRSSQVDPGDMSRSHGAMIGFAEEEASSLQFALGALRDTLTMLSGLPGKKVFVYVSNGLPMIPGLDLFYSFANTYHESSAITESARYNMNRSFNQLVSVANAQDVSFYTFGVGGLENPGMAASELGTGQDTMSASLGAQNYLDSLRFMADSTGGIATVNTNDFAPGLAKVAQDFFTYYSLGYDLQQSGLDKVHRIDVEIPDHPEYRLRYRQRFVEKSLESRIQDKVVTGLMFPLEDNPMEIMVEMGDATLAGETRWMVPLRLSFPLRKVALLPAGDDYVGNLTVFIAARSANGDRSDVVRQSHEVRVSASDYEQSQLERHALTANLLMEQGEHSVVIGVLDPITRASSFATTRITVQE